MITTDMMRRMGGVRHRYISAMMINITIIVLHKPPYNIGSPFFIDTLFVGTTLGVVKATDSFFPRLSSFFCSVYRMISSFFTVCTVLYSLAK